MKREYYCKEPEQPCEHASIGQCFLTDCRWHRVEDNPLTATKILEAHKRILSGPPIHPETIASPSSRYFETGATRDTEEGKLDYEGFLSPIVLKRFAEYMHKHRKQSDGKLRDSDNWQKGIPKTAYIKSMWRHFMDVWSLHRGILTPTGREAIEDTLCALIFNVMGYLFEVLREKDGTRTDSRKV